MSINVVRLFKYVVHIPDFNGSINTGGYDRVPRANCEWLKNKKQKWLKYNDTAWAGCGVGR